MTFWVQIILLVVSYFVSAALGSETAETETRRSGRFRYSCRRAGSPGSGHLRHDADYRPECALVWRSEIDADHF